MIRIVRIFIAIVFCVTISSGYALGEGRTIGETVDDSVITTEINAKIVKDPDLHFVKIDVDTREGNVTLTGKVPNEAAKVRLVELAGKVKGVKHVEDNLTVEATKSK